MLADPGRNKGFALGFLIEGLDRLLSRDVLALDVLEGVLLLPAVDGPQPAGKLGLAPSLFLDQFAKPAEGVLDIGTDGEMGVYVLVVLGLVDVEMDDVGFLGVLVHLAGDAVVEAGPGAKEKIALADRPVARHRSVHAVPVAGLGMIGVEYAQPHEGVRDGEPAQFGEFPEFLVGLRRNDAPAGVEHGLLGLGN